MSLPSRSISLSDEASDTRDTRCCAGRSAARRRDGPPAPRLPGHGLGSGLRCSSTGVPITNTSVRGVGDRRWISRHRQTTRSQRFAQQWRRTRLVEGHLPLQHRGNGLRVDVERADAQATIGKRQGQRQSDAPATSDDRNVNRERHSSERSRDRADTKCPATLVTGCSRAARRHRCARRNTARARRVNCSRVSVRGRRPPPCRQWPPCPPSVRLRWHWVVQPSGGPRLRKAFRAS